MSEFVSPVYNVRAIPLEKIKANNYNPNKVAPPEMKLLEISIWEDGFTQPIVCYHDKANDEYILQQCLPARELETEKKVKCR